MKLDDRGLRGILRHCGHSTHLLHLLGLLGLLHLLLLGLKGALEPGNRRLVGVDAVGRPCFCTYAACVMGRQMLKTGCGLWNSALHDRGFKRLKQGVIVDDVLISHENRKRLRRDEHHSRLHHLLTLRTCRSGNIALGPDDRINKRGASVRNALSHISGNRRLIEQWVILHTRSESGALLGCPFGKLCNTPNNWLINQYLNFLFCESNRGFWDNRL